MKRAEKLMKHMTFELEDDLVAYITEDSEQSLSLNDVPSIGLCG